MFIGLYDAVFDMSTARPLHDSRTGNKFMEDMRQGSLNNAQRPDINAYRQ